MDIAEVPAVSHDAAVLLTDTLHATGLASSLREALDPWTKPLAEHHAAKVLLDLAMTLAVGREIARDTDLLRCEPGLFGPVASAPTISRTLTTLAEDAPAVIAAVFRARRTARERAWTLAGGSSPAAQASPKNPLVIDLDATLNNVDSGKEQAAPTFKRGEGVDLRLPDGERQNFHHHHRETSPSIPAPTRPLRDPHLHPQMRRATLLNLRRGDTGSLRRYSRILGDLFASITLVRSELCREHQNGAEDSGNPHRRY